MDDVTSVLRPLLLVCTPFGAGLLDADAGLSCRLFRSASSLLVVGVAVTEVVSYLLLTLSQLTLSGQTVSHVVAILLTGTSSCVSAGVYLLDRSGVVASFRRVTAASTPLHGQDFRRFRRCVVALLVVVLAYNATLVSLRLAEASDVYFAASIFLHVVNDLTVLQLTVLVALLWDQHRRLNSALLETFQRSDRKLIHERVSGVRRRHAELTWLSEQVLGVFGPTVVAVVVKTTLSVVAVIFEAISRFAKQKTFTPSTVVTVTICVQIVSSSLKLLCLTTSCHCLTSESARTASLAVELMLDEEDHAQELEDLARQVRSVSTPKRAVGVVTLDGKLLVGVVSTVATYVVILLQFALEEESHLKG